MRPNNNAKCLNRISNHDQFLQYWNCKSDRWVSVCFIFKHFFIFIKICPDLWILNLSSYLWARRLQDLQVHQLWKLQLHLQTRLLRRPLWWYDWHDALLQCCFSFLGGQECSTEQEFVSDSAMPQEFGVLPKKTMLPCWMSVIIQTDMASPCLLCSPCSDRRLMLQNNCFMAPFISLPTRGRASCLDLKGPEFYEMAPLFGIHFLDI